MYKFIDIKMNMNFEELWDMRPDDNQYARIFGKNIKVPRKYKVYGEQYKFSGQENVAIEVPRILKPFCSYGNSILVNWYENGDDYIGYHSDDEKGLIGDIYAFSYGSERRFKFQNKETKEVDTLMLKNNSCLVMLDGCQKIYKHSLPKMKNVGRRISITCRVIKKEENNCPICLENVNTQTIGKVCGALDGCDNYDFCDDYKCKHYFCSWCLRKMYDESDNKVFSCPLCREDISGFMNEVYGPLEV